MEERAGGIIEVEAGDEILVVTAKHADGSTALVGSFTSYRLAGVGAKAYADEYGKNGDGARGDVLSTETFSTCLNQHRVCPEVGAPAVYPHATPRSWAMVSRAVDDILNRQEEPPANTWEEFFRAARGRASFSAEPHPGPYTRELLESGLPDHALLVGAERVAESKTVVWDLFEINECTVGDLDLASRLVGHAVVNQEPEVDYDSKTGDEDDIDAVLSYLRSGGALCKVPDAPGSKYFRFLVVPFPGSPVRGNCA